MPVPDFSPGEVLTAAAMDSIGLWLVKTQTIGTGVSSVTVTDAFSATYDNYKVTFSGGISSTSNSALNLRFGAKTTNYRSGMLYNSWANTPISLGGTTETSILYAGSLSSTGCFVNMDVINPFLALNTLVNASYNHLNTAGYAFGNTGDTTSYSDFTLIPTSGTLTGGTIRVYGYRN
jgi:hypothetical protein